MLSPNFGSENRVLWWAVLALVAGQTACLAATVVVRADHLAGRGPQAPASSGPSARVEHIITNGQHCMTIHFASVARRGAPRTRFVIPLQTEAAPVDFAEIHRGKWLVAIAADVQPGPGRPLCPGDIVDWRGFCARLSQQGRSKKNSPGRRIWEQMSDQLRSDIQSTAKHKGISNAIRGRILKYINERLKDKNFYDPKDFNGVPLGAECQSLVKRREALSENAAIHMNRMLIEAAYPRHVASHRMSQVILTVEHALVDKPTILKAGEDIVQGREAFVRRYVDQCRHAGNNAAGRVDWLMNQVFPRNKRLGQRTKKIKEHMAQFIKGARDEAKDRANKEADQRGLKDGAKERFVKSRLAAIEKQSLESRLLRRYFEVYRRAIMEAQYRRLYHEKPPQCDMDTLCARVALKADDGTIRRALVRLGVQSSPRSSKVKDMQKRRSQILGIFEYLKGGDANELKTISTSLWKQAPSFLKFEVKVSLREKARRGPHVGDANGDWLTADSMGRFGPGVKRLILTGSLDPWRGDRQDWWDISGFAPKTSSITLLKPAQGVALQLVRQVDGGECWLLKALAHDGRRLPYQIELRRKGSSSRREIVRQESPSGTFRSFPY